ncbi:MAG: hypothetical protein OEZ43_02580 [Gammaproteobacteria bacterium]|nr:hypothetical protein [Gammaproteobacteria bacterium]
MENKEEFTSNKNGMGRRIRITLDIVENLNQSSLGKFGDRGNKAEYIQRQKRLLGLTTEEKPISSKFNLNYMGSLWKKELYISTKENEFIYYECDANPEEGRAFSPSCETKFPVWGNVVLEYRFHKTYLKDWQKIHADVIRFVGDMEVGPNKLFNPVFDIGD